MTFFSCSCSCYILTSWFLSLGKRGRPVSASPNKSVHTVWLSQRPFTDRYLKHILAFAIIDTWPIRTLVTVNSSSMLRRAMSSCSRFAISLNRTFLTFSSLWVLYIRQDKESGRGKYQTCYKAETLTSLGSRVMSDLYWCTWTLTDDMCCPMVFKVCPV